MATHVQINMGDIQNLPKRGKMERTLGLGFSCFLISASISEEAAFGLKAFVMAHAFIYLVAIVCRQSSFRRPTAAAVIFACISFLLLLAAVITMAYYVLNSDCHCRLLLLGYACLALDLVGICLGVWFFLKHSKKWN